MNSSRRHATAVFLEDHDLLQPATCPRCHTSSPLDISAIEAGGAWRCVRCGQHWDASRLKAVAAYAAWSTEHDGPGGTERLDGTP